MDLEVRHLTLVLAVAEEGTLTRAAERLHLSQSALSHQLLGIERRLRVALFHRVGKRMVLTQAGERLLRSSRQVVAELERTEEEIRQLAQNRRGMLRVTTECYTCYHWLPSVLRRFQLRHPTIDVSIDVDATKEPFEAVAGGRVDLALVSSEGKDRRVDLRPLFKDEMVVLVAAEHPFAAQHFVQPRQLAGETLLTYMALEDSTAYKRLLRPLGLRPKSHLQVRLTEAMVELVRNGLGVSVAARWSVAPHIASGAVVAVPVTRRGLWRQWQAATLRSPSVPAYVGDFIAMLAREAPETRDVPAYAPPVRRTADRLR